MAIRRSRRLHHLFSGDDEKDGAEDGARHGPETGKEIQAAQPRGPGRRQQPDLPEHAGGRRQKADT
ncbi:hypothetical protein D3C78_1788930 [compost metagenome]